MSASAAVKAETGGTANIGLDVVPAIDPAASGFWTRFERDVGPAIAAAPASTFAPTPSVRGVASMHFRAWSGCCATSGSAIGGGRNSRSMPIRICENSWPDLRDPCRLIAELGRAEARARKLRHELPEEGQAQPSRFSSPATGNAVAANGVAAAPPTLT
jgi:hypothetical protein